MDVLAPEDRTLHHVSHVSALRRQEKHDFRVFCAFQRQKALWRKNVKSLYMRTTRPSAEDRWPGYLKPPHSRLCQRQMFEALSQDHREQMSLTSEGIGRGVGSCGAATLLEEKAKAIPLLQDYLQTAPRTFSLVSVQVSVWGCTWRLNCRPSRLCARKKMRFAIIGRRSLC